MRKAADISSYETETLAEQACRRFNQHREGDVYVITDGPEGDYVVMPVSEAIEMDLLYRWVV